MTALAGNRKDYIVETPYYELVIVTDDLLYEGAVVGKWTTGADVGKISPAEASLDMEILGVHTGKEITGDGTKVGQIREAELRLFATGLTEADRFKPIYMTDDKTFTLTAGSARPAGYIVNVLTSTTAACRVGKTASMLAEVIADVATMLATGVGVASKAVGFADLVALGAVTSGAIDFAAALPAGAVVIGYGANVTAIFDNAGDTASGTFDLGIKSGDTDVWVDGGSLNAVAKVSTPSGTDARLVGAITPTLPFVFDVNFDTLTKGAMVAYVLYVEAF